MQEHEKFVMADIEADGGMAEIEEAIGYINEYLNQDYYPSKNARLAEWDPTDEEIYELIICIFTVVLVHHKVTYQAMVGTLNYKLNQADVIDRVKTLAEVVALISRTGLIDITRSGSGQYIMISTEFELDKEIPFVDRHGTVYHRPQPVESNWDPEQGSMLLGGKMNHHEDKVCLDHINRMNNIPLALNREFMFRFKEQPKDTAVDNFKKRQNWMIYEERAKWKYVEALAQDRNMLFLNHKYCTRGRTYAVGYYINTQGSAYKKACLELFNKEYLNEE